MSHFIEDKTINNKMRLFDPVDGNMLDLKFKALHEGIVKKGDYYVSYAYFYDQSGRKIDVDFLVIPDGKELKTVQAIVHSIDGEKRKFFFLNWYKQFDGFLFNRKLFAAFGSLATIILIYFVINNLFYNVDDKSAASILYRVSKEIAVNHSKNLGPEYYSDSFTKLKC